MEENMHPFGSQGSSHVSVLTECAQPALQIRSDTSQILEEHLPVLKAKLTEMRGIYTKVDRLEAFVKMVGRHVAFLEADVLQAERDHGAFPQSLRRWLGSAGLPSFGNVSILPREVRGGPLRPPSADPSVGRSTQEAEFRGHISLLQTESESGHLSLSLSHASPGL
ncbi:breast carcinoma-amplified sequence 4 isoform X3 [Saimiri boliviensis]|uniref:breast carcinoma-amplified sequence 4 isoform X3 n=1 Tax=Saimiri boliviensis TaxID=27679 RepID=UPI003D788AA1